MGYAVGQWETPTLTVSPYGDDTAVVLHVRYADADGDPVDTTLTAVTADAGHSWTAPEVTYTVAGLWRLVWVVTGTGAGTTTVTRSIAPDPAVAPTLTSYVTTVELADYLGEAVDVGAERALRNATREIRRLTAAAIYQVDEHDLPTDTALLTALKEATCELVRWWAETGDELGVRALVTSASISGASLGFNTAAMPYGGRYGPSVVTILQAAGLINSAVLTYG